MMTPSNAEQSLVVAERVATARDIQRERFVALGSTATLTNTRADTSQIEAIANADSSALALLRDAAESTRLSARGYHRVLKVARTLADLGGAEAIGRIHIAEALSFRIAGAQTALAA